MDVPWKAWNVYRKTTPPTEVHVHLLVTFPSQLWIICNTMSMEEFSKGARVEVVKCIYLKGEDGDGKTNILGNILYGNFPPITRIVVVLGVSIIMG